MNQKPSRFAYQARRHLPERIIQGILFLAAFSAVAVTIAIMVILIYESLGFFAHVSIIDFLTDTQWTPLFSDKHFGVLPLVTGTLVVAAVALSIAVPLGTITAIYLSEFAPHRVREIVKPFLELLERACRPWCTATSRCCSSRRCCSSFIPGLPGFNMLGPGS